MATNPEYLHLSVSERIQLVEDIWDSISADAANAFPLTKRQRDELDRRMAEHIANPSDAIPWEVVRAKLFSKSA